MTNFHKGIGPDGQPISRAFTAEEDIDFDAREVAHAAALPMRQLASLRTKRNILLAESDWTQYNDSPMANEAKAEWAVHRQLLRDLPENTDAADPTWPTPPE
jgi:hypothetical protein